MSMLTTLLLTDAVEKGGPGSGPQGGKGGKGNEKEGTKSYKSARDRAMKLTERADRERTGAGKASSHAMAWKAHLNAAKKAPDAKTAKQHDRMAEFHNKEHKAYTQG